MRASLRNGRVFVVSLLAAVTVAMAVAASVGVAAPTRADRARGTHVFGPNDRPFGKTYSQWAAAWWTWALTQPADVNPIGNDLAGTRCAQGQRGHVWFIGATFGNPLSVTRTCTVPKGTGLLFPVVNQFAGAIPSDPPEQKTEAFQRSQVRPPVLAATNLHATIDGVPVPHIKRYFEDSIVFRVVLPANNIFGLNHLCTDVAPVDAGCTIFPTVDAGYYLALSPFGRGTHTLNFGGTANDLSFDATYNIIVRKDRDDRHGRGD